MVVEQAAVSRFLRAWRFTTPFLMSESRRRAAGGQRIVGDGEQHGRGRRAGDPDPAAAAQEETSTPVPAQGGRRGQEERSGAKAPGASVPADAVPPRPGRRVTDVGADHRADGFTSGCAGQRVRQQLERQQVTGPVSHRFGRAWRRRRLAGLVRGQRGRVRVAKRRNS